MTDEYSNPPSESDNQPAPSPSAEGKLNWFEVWKKAITKPQPETFSELASNETKHLQTAIIWVSISAVITSILTSFNRSSANQAIELFSEYTEIDPSYFASGPNVFGSFLAIPISIVFGVIAAFAFAGIVHFISKMLGGEGDFAEFFYSVAAFQAPLSILTSFLALIPLIGCLNIFIAFYMLYLLMQAVRGIHLLDSGKAAISSIGVPVGCFFFVFCCIFIIAMLAGIVFAGGEFGMILPFL